MHQNVTLKLDKDLLRKARVYSIKEGASLSRLMTRALGRLVESSEGYEKARKRALARMKKGFYLGGGPYYASRSRLHDRHGR